MYGGRIVESLRNPKFIVRARPSAPSLIQSPKNREVRDRSWEKCHTNHDDPIRPTTVASAEVRLDYPPSLRQRRRRLIVEHSK
jgi:hypothetical protein